MPDNVNARGSYSTPARSGEPGKPVTIGRVIAGGLLGLVVIGIPAILITKSALDSDRRREPRHEPPQVDQRAIRARVLARAARTDPRVLESSSAAKTMKWHR